LIDDLLVDPTVIKRLKLTQSQLALLSLLLRRVSASHEQIVSHLYGHRIDGGPDDARKCVEVYIYWLRKALQPHGVKIDNIFGVGYFMSAKHKEKTRKLLKGSLQ